MAWLGGYRFYIFCMAGWLCCFPVLVQAAAGDVSPYAMHDAGAIALSGGGSIVKKMDRQSIGNCIAERFWIEPQGLKNTAAQTQITRHYRTLLAVGKRLTRFDCGNTDRYALYQNVARITGIQGNAVGVQTVIGIPGSVPSEACEWVNLATGKRLDMRNYLTPAGKRTIATLLCDYAAHYDYPPMEGFYSKKTFCNGYDAFIQNSWLRMTQICLLDTGAAFRYAIDTHAAKTLMIPEEQMSSSFDLPL